MWTSHRQKLGEMRGKASNVDWAAREAAKEFRRLGMFGSHVAIQHLAFFMHDSWPDLLLLVKTCTSEVLTHQHRARRPQYQALYP